MSSLPGYKLEDFLAWQYDLTIEDQAEANISLGMAEALYTSVRVRPRLTQKEFKPIIDLFEYEREHIEQLLEDFDEENQSWRDYAGACFSFLPDTLDNAVLAYLKTLKEPKVEYIIKDTIRQVKSYLTIPAALKSLTDAVAVLVAHSHNEHHPQDEFVKARVSVLLRDVSSVFPSTIDYLTGNGLIARYIKEHLAIEHIFADELQTVRNEAIRTEIDTKFNLNPSANLSSVEYTNIVQLLIKVEGMLESADIHFEPLGSDTQITESGCYLYPDNQKAINLVMEVNGLVITITSIPNQNPFINLFHPWEEVNLNIYNVCYIPGMYAAMVAELNKITTV